MSQDENRESNFAYHADCTHIGHSMARVAQESLQRYHGIYVARTMPPDEPTVDMILGSLVHGLALTPEDFGDEYLVAEGCASRRGKKWDAYKQEADATQRTAVIPAWVELATAMREAVYAKKQARFLLENAAVVEQSMRWREEATELKLKAKPDFLVTEEIEGYHICGDLKTSGNPRRRPFMRSVFDYDYHGQHEWYLPPCRERWPGPWMAVWIAVWKTPPHDVYLWRCPADLLDIGARQNAAVLQSIAEAHRTYDWRMPDQKQMGTLEPEPWMLREQ